MTSLQSVAQELKWAARRLVRSRGFAVTSIGFLGIAIGVATTVFSFINSALIRPLPYAEADRLVAVTEDDGQSSLRRILVSTSTLAALRREARSFDAIAAYRDNVVVVATGDQVQTLVVTEVDSAALGTLGVRPQLGSAPTNADYASGARVALVSDRYWRSRLGGSNDVIGIELRIRDTAYHITGVMPPGFGFSGNSDVWLPLASTSPDANSNSSEL